MSRQPTPRPPRSACITAAGKLRLEQEYQRLWSVERPKLAREVGEAAALGDRSENAEHIYGKRRLREIDSRLEFLSRRLCELRVNDSEVLGGGGGRFSPRGSTPPQTAASTSNIRSSGPTSSTPVRAGSAWTRRSARPCSANAAETRSWCGVRRAPPGSRSRACTTGFELRARQADVHALPDVPGARLGARDVSGVVA